MHLARFTFRAISCITHDIVLLDILLPALRAHLDQVLHTVVLPGFTRLNSEGARLNR